MAQVLELAFATAVGKKMTLTIDNPKPAITATEVQSGMQTIITSQVFYIDGQPIQSAVSARIVERNVTEIF